MNAITWKKYFVVGTNGNALHDTMNGSVVGELVCCKDCKWYDTSDISGTVEPIGYRCKLVARLWREPDDFCKGAERKEE